MENINLYIYVQNSTINKVDFIGLSDFECNKDNVGRYKDLQVKVQMKTMLQPVTLADTDDFSFSKHIKNAIKKKVRKKQINT